MSNFSKFKRGDRVKTIYGAKGIVQNTYKFKDIFKIKINFDSGLTSDYNEEDIKFYHEDIDEVNRVDDKHIGDKCPKCSTPWTKTSFGSKTWYDCTPCKKKAEDLLSYSPPPIPKKKDDDDFDSMLQEFADMLGDDDDDFGVPF